MKKRVRILEEQGIVKGKPGRLDKTGKSLFSGKKIYPDPRSV
jgi:hypothetical protein